MQDPLHIVDVCVRLAGAGPASRHRYRPLVIGQAWLERPAGSGPWLVRLTDVGWLRPAPEPYGSGLQAWAILCPEDLSPEAGAAPCLSCVPEGAETSRSEEIEIQGWCLMYDPAASAAGLSTRHVGGGRVAYVDASDGDPRMPAVFELPGELFERLEYLANRGIPARPLALPTNSWRKS
jgi:hypothetical protein